MMGDTRLEHAGVIRSIPTARIVASRVDPSAVAAAGRCGSSCATSLRRFKLLTGTGVRLIVTTPTGPHAVYGRCAQALNFCR